MKLRQDVPIVPALMHYISSPNSVHVQNEASESPDLELSEVTRASLNRHLITENSAKWHYHSRSHAFQTASCQ
jgi:hypothetical protein